MRTYTFTLESKDGTGYTTIYDDSLAECFEPNLKAIADKEGIAVEHSVYSVTTLKLNKETTNEN